MLKLTHNNLLYMNIYTCGEYINLTHCKNSNINKYNNFVDKCIRKLGTDIDINYEYEYIRKSSLYSEHSKIICVTIGLYKEEKYIIKTYKGEEIDILQNIKKVFDYFNNSINIIGTCGYNIKNFYIPYLSRKFITYDMGIPQMIKTYNTKPWEQNIIDILEIWKFNSYTFYTLNEICTELNIEYNNIINIENLHELYYDNIKNIDKIVEQCELDIHLIMDISRKILINI